jgi:hypothetical protein
MNLLEEEVSMESHICDHIISEVLKSIVNQLINLIKGHISTLDQLKDLKIIGITKRYKAALSLPID